MSKSSGYKNYKYKIFVENIRDLPFKNKSAKEQYEEVYKFVQQESAKNEEDTYTFAKRYLSNTNYKHEDSSFTVSLLASYFFGLLSSWSYNWIYKWLFNESCNIIIKILSLIVCFCPCIIILYYILKNQYKKAMINRSMDNDEIILAVLEDYCKEVEQTFRQKGETNE